MCMKAPIVQQPDTLPDSCNLFSLLFSGKKRKKRQNDDEFDDFDFDSFDEFDNDNEEATNDMGEFFRCIHNNRISSTTYNHFSKALPTYLKYIFSVVSATLLVIVKFWKL